MTAWPTPVLGRCARHWILSSENCALSCVCFALARLSCTTRLWCCACGRSNCSNYRNGVSRFILPTAESSTSHQLRTCCSTRMLTSYHHSTTDGRHDVAGSPPAVDITGGNEQNAKTYLPAGQANLKICLP